MTTVKIFKIEKALVGHGQTTAITREKAIELIEGKGYYSKGTVDALIQHATTGQAPAIETPWSRYVFLRDDHTEKPCPNCSMGMHRSKYNPDEDVVDNIWACAGCGYSELIDANEREAT